MGFPCASRWIQSLRPRLLGEEGLVHHGVPLDVANPPSCRACARWRRPAWRLPICRSAPCQPLVEMGVEDLHALRLRRRMVLRSGRARRFARVQPLPAAAHHEQLRLVRAACVDDAVLNPLGARQDCGEAPSVWRADSAEAATGTACATEEVPASHRSRLVRRVQPVRSKEPRRPLLAMQLHIPLHGC